MPFSEDQKTRFTKSLESKGWRLSDGTIWSTTKGLWFDNSHFTHWTPSQMHEIFAKRAERIAKAQIGDFQTSSRENHEAALAAQEVI